jgi:hypothetical protein
MLMSATMPAYAEASALTGELSAALASPTRNKYFYGKLLDAHHLQLEQQYFLDQSRRINRLGLGFGVLCGLQLELTADGSKVIVHPGVAIDGCGREIVVPAPVCVDPSALDSNDDDNGDAEPGFTICVCYHECETEPAPALVSECDVRERCVNGLIRERFRIHLHRGVPDTPPYLGATGRLRDLIHRVVLLERELAGDPGDHRAGGPVAPASPREIGALQVAAVVRPAVYARRPLVRPDPSPIDFDSCSAPSDPCVVLGTVMPPAEEKTALDIDDFTYRRTIMSNDGLFELVLALTEVVERCCRSVKATNTVTVKAGDAQSGKAKSVLAKPVVVEVRGPDNEPVVDESVSFEVTSASGGSFDPAQQDTDAEGTVSTAWTLGDAGPQTGRITVGDQTVEITATSK